MSAGTAARRLDAGMLGNALVSVALLALAVLLARWQAEPWQWRDPGAGRWWFAFAVTGLWLGFTGAVALSRRQQRQNRLPVGVVESGPFDWLVVHASQTGYAEQLALMTVAALQAAGQRVRLAPLGTLTSDDIGETRQALFIASTTGEGDPPDPTMPFVRKLLDRPAAFGHLRYGLLALGDREYDAFCAFGHRLDGWLRHSHAHPLFDPVEVDNGDPGALRLWQQHLGQLTGRTDQPDWNRPAYRHWRLDRREHLNSGSLGGPVFDIRLQPDDPGHLDWTAGDIAEIGPRHAGADIDSWLAMAGLDGDTTVNTDSRPALLREVLTGSTLPAPVSVEGRNPQAIADALEPLPHREYSIASIPAEGHLRLLLRQMRHPDGRLGSGSGWLSEHARIGSPIALRIRRNRGFHLNDDDRPLILIGNGTGLAGLRALLRERIERGHGRNWLLFGERQRRHDLHFGNELQAWRAQGWLSRLDLAFSRDGNGTYVQNRLREQATRLHEWIKDGAAVHVCGSLQGMAPGVDAVLRETLGDGIVDNLVEDGRYRRDVY